MDHSVVFLLSPKRAVARTIYVRRSHLNRRWRCLVILILTTLRLTVRSADADEWLLGNHLYRDESVASATQDTSTVTVERPECLSCVRVGQYHDGCGERMTLTQLWSPWSAPRISVGGWQQLGYTEQSTGLFNTDPDRVNLQQSWLYAERTSDTSLHDWDWGFRADILYGTDADNTQAFGNPPGQWDYLNGLDFGIYAWAIPQLYGELAYQDLKVSIGHFYTIVGYEVVTAPDNFFYSHSYTFTNSEPFTATGVVTEYSADERLTIYHGWTLGWDSGFSQLASGSNYVGGIRAMLSPKILATYTTTIGNFGVRGRGAYMHSILLEVQATERLNCVVQHDLLRVTETGEDTIGLNQYWTYTLSDSVALGSRIEWWKADGVTGFTYGNQITPPVSSSSYYEATFGVNLRPHPNLVMRPELRIDWAPFADYRQSIFAMDLIWLF